MAEELESCPNCEYSVIERATYCPHCGYQLTYPLWKKAGAWALLIVIIWVLAKCHIQMFEGLDSFAEPDDQSLWLDGPPQQARNG